MPALPLDEAGKYVAGAYVTFMALVLVYVAIMGAKLSRIQREIAELARHRPATDPAKPDAGASPARSPVSSGAGLAGAEDLAGDVDD